MMRETMNLSIRTPSISLTSNLNVFQVKTSPSSLASFTIEIISSSVTLLSLLFKPKNVNKNDVFLDEYLSK